MQTDTKENSVNRYAVTIRHDCGIVKFKVVATSGQAAVNQVCEAENAPDNAVLNVELLENL